MPELQCEVYDYLFSGMVNPLIGVFLLNVKNLVKLTNKQIEEDMKITRIKVGVYLTSGLLEKNVGALGKLDKLLEKTKNEENKKDENEEEINTNKKVKLIEDKEENVSDKISNNDTLINLNYNESNLKPDDVILQINNSKDDLKKELTKVNTKSYDKNFIKENKSRSEYFVLLPQYKTFTIPGIKNDSPYFKEYQIEDINKSPDTDDYMPIGYISKQKYENEKGEFISKDMSNPKNISKHYRRIFGEELEKARGLGLKSPFHQSSILRSKDEDKKDEMQIFSAISNIDNKIIKTYDIFDDKLTYEEREKIEEENMKKRGKFVKNLVKREKNENISDETKLIIPKNLNRREFGYLKAVIRIAEKQKMLDYQKAIDEYKAKDIKIMKELRNLDKYEKLTKAILVKKEVIIRVYILELNELTKKDITSESDPYIKIYLGDKLKFDEQKNHFEDTKNCKWYQYYDILTQFPGNTSLKIEVWDYDPIFRDELIGSTTIDLEDRYYNSNWRDMKFKPIEVRKLMHPDYSIKQGLIYLWVEMFEKRDRLNMEPWQIKPEPLSQIEMRLIIWETEDIEMMDVEGTSDVYINAYVDPKEKQSTDVHYRCQNGVASFNWRIVLPINLPSNNQTLTLHAYDRDLLNANDFITGANLNLKNILKIPKDLDVPIVFNKQYVDGVDDTEKRLYKDVEFLSESDDPDKIKFWIQCYKNNQKSGKIMCSLEFLPKWKAEQIKVGKGREEPNICPYLPPPVGRFEFSLNPLKTFNQCVGPRFRKKFYCGLCCLCLIIYLIFMIPYMIYHFSGQIANPFNYI